jgi:hypothetical protein
MYNLKPDKASYTCVCVCVCVCVKTGSITFEMLLREDGSKPPKIIEAKTTFFLYILCMCELLALIVRILLHCTE